MSPSTWERVESIFLEAADLTPEEQARFLDRACGGDADMRREVQSLLDSDRKSGDGIARAVEGEAQALLGVGGIIGARLGAYKVIREIGRGGMGAVYLATRDDDQFKMQAAIKVIKRGMDTDDVVSRFCQERQILAGLNHPYIARLLDAGVAADGRPFFVMEFVEGRPIDVDCRHRALSIKDRCRLFLKVCEAVSHAHRHLVVHRDLKPGNIFVTPEGSPKLLDFGVAKLLTPSSNPALTQTGVYPARLTPQYASPEQVLGKPVTTSSDVYSLGAVFYELLTGAPAQPLKSTTSSEEMERVICRTEINRPSKTGGREIEGDLDNIVLMAMRKDPERRYASVDQFAEDIQRFLNGRPVLARKDSLGYRARKFLVRNRFPIAAGAMIFASLVAGIVIARSQAQRAERRLAQMVELANRSLFDVHSAIERLPGSTAARREIVRTTLEYLENLRKDAGSDERVRLALSTAYFRLGDVQGYQFVPNLGDTQGALESYRKAAALIGPLYAKHPRDPDVLQRFVETQRRIGTMLDGMTDLKGAIAAYQAALPAAELLGKLRPSDLESARAEGSLYDSLSTAFQYSDHAQAAEYARRQIEAFTPLAAKYPDNASVLDDLSSGHARLGQIYNRDGKLDLSMQEFRKCVAIREQSAKAHPNDVVIRRSLMLGYGHLAGVMGAPFVPNLGDSKGARDMYLKAAAIARNLHQADPEDRTAQFDLASVLLRLAAVTPAPEQINESLAMLHESEGLMMALGKADPKATRYSIGLGMVYEFEGHRLHEQGKTDEAIAAHKRAIDVSEGIIAHLNYAPALSTALANEYQIAGIMAERGARAAALSTAQHAVTRAQAYLQGPEPSIRRANLGNAYVQLASVYRTLAQRGGSQEDWRQARQAVEQARAEWNLTDEKRAPSPAYESRAKALLAECDAALKQ